MKIGKKLNKWRAQGGVVAVRYEVTGNAEEIAEYLAWKAEKGYNEEATIVLFDQVAQKGDEIIKTFGTDGSDGKYVLDFDEELDIMQRKQLQANANAYMSLFGARAKRVVRDEVSEEVTN